MRIFLRWVIAGCLLSGVAVAENTSLSPAFNGTIASLIAGAATGIPLTVTNVTTPLTLTNAGPATSPAAQEWLWSANVAANVMAVQNLNTSGFSAITFRDALNYEHGAIGGDQGDGTPRLAAGVVTGSISTTTLTVASITSGSVAAGNTIAGAGVTAGTKVVVQLTNTGAASTGAISGVIFTASATTTSGYAVGTVITGSGVTAGTRITRLITGVGGNGTYGVLPAQTVSSTAISQTQGSGTYSVNISQTVGSTTLTMNGEDVSTNSNDIFLEASDLYGSPKPPTNKRFQTFGQPFMQYWMDGFDVNGNYSLDPLSGGGGNIEKTDHIRGYLGIGGTVSGWAPSAALDIYLAVAGGSDNTNQCVVVGHQQNNHGGVCNYGLNPASIVILDTAPELSFIAPNTRAFIMLDDTAHILKMMDPAAGGTAWTMGASIDGTFTSNFNGPTKYLAAVKTTPSTGGTVTYAATQRLAIIVPAGLLATLTVTLPACAAANDGDERAFLSTQVISALTVGASSGSVVGGATSAAVGSGHTYHCYGADTAWYQMN